MCLCPLSATMQALKAESADVNHKPLLTSIVETADGEVVLQVEGGKPTKDVSVADGMLVIYQKDMIGRPNIEERTHRNLLSPFQVQKGDNCAHVPWHNIGWWSAPHKYAKICVCSTCNSTNCRNRFRKVRPDHVKVVWVHDANGRVDFQWYVLFEGQGDIMTLVPPDVVTELIKEINSAEDEQDALAWEPLLEQVGRQNDNSYSRWVFNALATKRFVAYRKRVHVQVAREKGRMCTPIVPITYPVHVGQCTICLDENKLVSNAGCVHKRCSIAVCADCRIQTRGMCPLCDRNKLAPDALFMCMACDAPCKLPDYGYPCIQCGKPDLCADCYGIFGQCLSCECDISVESKRKRDV